MVLVTLLSGDAVGNGLIFVLDSSREGDGGGGGGGGGGLLGVNAGAEAVELTEAEAVELVEVSEILEDVGVGICGGCGCGRG